MTSSTQRQSLRQQLRQQRRQLSLKQQQAHGKRLANNLRLNRYFSQVKDVAFYLAEDAEISTSAAIKAAWKSHKNVYLPVLSPYADELFFAPYRPTTSLKLNRFGIAEPAVAIRHCKRAHQLQLIFMPLVGFDIKGNRLGMGGGFYDRSLHFRQHQQSWRKPRLIGLAHECQKVAAIPVEHWDIPLDGIATEKTFYKIKSSCQKQSRFEET
ncbi:MAG: 5-formyltetrahydrofolate cyclo-ligase [Gammaproteobacteria bacterium]|nr:5-formyltetrahydrofolate cyclo-ligase [Gammaproteobacteria bacterium]